MDRGDISVVIPAFRAAETIRRTLDSCLPTVRPQNIFVVLDGPDAALEAATRASHGDVKIKVMPAKSGAPACRNVGLAQLGTEFVIFLDADDYVEGSFLPAACQSATRSSADVVLGRFSFEQPDGSRSAVDPQQLYGKLQPDRIMKTWLTGGYTPPCAVVWRSDFISNMGGWDESLAKNQDGDTMFRALMSDARVTGCSEGQGIYVQDSNPLRITLRHDARTLGSQFAVLEKIRLTLGSLPYDPSAELGSAYYNLARLAFTVGVAEIGQSAEAISRSLGVVGQPGSFVHRTLAGFLGLRSKQRLASVALKLRTRPGRLSPPDVTQGLLPQRSSLGKYNHTA